MFNLHTHTGFSDGADTPEVMIGRALELGFTSIGISDHSETAFDPDYCMAASDYPFYQREIRRLQKKYEDRIPVFLGIEKDYYSPIQREDYDYVIGSVHYLMEPDGHVTSIDAGKAGQETFIETLGGGDPLVLARRYYENVADHAQRGEFDVQGHFDLVNKYALFEQGGKAYRDLALEALDAVMEKVDVIEVNTGALARGYSVLYPADFLLLRILEKKGRITLSSDCHKAENLSSFFEVITGYLKGFGFSSLWEFSRQGWQERPL